MPVGWFMFSTASTPAGRRCGRDPERCQVEFENDLRRCRAELIEGLFFDADTRTASALVKDLDLNNTCRKGMIQKWGGRYRKLLSVEEAAEAFAIARELEEAADEASGEGGAPSP
jgi:hypothetical protein